MKVSGFTFVRNAVKYDYPIVESINSLLPLVDEYIVCVGNSDDDTIQLIESIPSPKIKIVHSVWDDTLREGGQVLAVETNKAKAAVSNNSDWLFYLQGDECIHEQDYKKIRDAMLAYKNNPGVDGLLFKYLHFFGSYKYIGDSRRWYRREIRIIKNNTAIKSWKDAQGFRKNAEKLRVKLIDAFVYHYGWVKDPHLQKAKQMDFGRFWIQEDEKIEQFQQYLNSFNNGYSYENEIDSLKLFTGTHPSAMQQRVAAEDWNFEYSTSQKKFRSFKYKLMYQLEKISGIRFFEYKNYKRI
jgi:hypothetical protein